MTKTIKIETRKCTAYKCEKTFKIYYLDIVKRDFLRNEETGEIVKNVDQFVFAGNCYAPLHVQNLNLCPECCEQQGIISFSEKSKQLAIEAGFPIE
jgi:hypothetical protein